jgi:hypothetical protein
LGDDQVDFKGIFGKLMQYGYRGWAVLESECAFKDKYVCAVEGAAIIKSFIPVVATGSFDDFAKAPVDQEGIDKLLGL